MDDAEFCAAVKELAAQLQQAFADPARKLFDAGGDALARKGRESDKGTEAVQDPAMRLQRIAMEAQAAAQIFMEYLQAALDLARRMHA